MGGIHVLTKRVEGMDMSELRDLADVLRQRLGSGVVVLGAESQGKAMLVAAVTKDLMARVRADDIIRRIAPLVKGGGGGRADFAQAGGSQPQGLERSLQEVYAAVKITPKGD